MNIFEHVSQYDNKPKRCMRQTRCFVAVFCHIVTTVQLRFNS